jgi:predicted ATPase/DNA-binding SARP family transcriptional activator
MPGSECETPLFSLRLFGPFEVCLNGQALPRLRSRKGHHLLACLALRHGRDVKRSWLAGTLWPDSSEAPAFANLRNTLSDLRPALGAAAARLRSPTPHTLCLDLAGAEVDLLAFDDAIERGDTASLQEAVSLYRGALLEGWAEEWTFREREQREQAYLRALESLAAEALGQGQPEAAEGYLRRAVAVEPLRESAQRGLMEALSAGGNYGAAVEVYRELRLLLHRELNAEPDPETQALFQQIRAGKVARPNPPAPFPRPQAAPALAGARREGGRGVRWSGLPLGTLTFLFTNIVGSTRLLEQRPQAMREALARHDELLRRAIEGHGGRVFKTVGGQFCAAFSAAAEAVAAALTAQRALREPWKETGPVRVRMALHTGDAEGKEGDYTGLSLHRVAHLLAEGHGGQILLSQATGELVRDVLPEGIRLRDLGEHLLKGQARAERVFQVIAPDLPAEFPPLRSLEARPGNLRAPLTSLVGRQQEVAAAGELLQRESVRLLTFTGPGGTGKTRLALDVATALRDELADGVFFVDLAPIRDPELVISTIIQVLGARETGEQSLLESLKAHLRERQMLLLLDNFEQVVSAAPLIVELLEAAPRLKVLATSREPLHVRGEQEFPVSPLAVPAAGRGTAEEIARYGAVELFVQRATQAKPQFDLTDENAGAVAEICRRLDGLPLALELAAARVKLFAPAALLSRLQDRLTLLAGGGRDAPPRQRTLRDTIQWSYDLLEPEEQRLFRRLTVFAGGCTLEAAETVCAGDGIEAGDILEHLTLLVEKSLVVVDDRQIEESRYRLLETIRQYGAEQLGASGEERRLRERHRDWFLALAEKAEPFVGGENRGPLLDTFERELDNLRAALQWSREQGEAALELRLAAALILFWGSHAHWEEGRQWLEGALARAASGIPQPDRVLTRARALALRGAGQLATELGDHAAARARLEESVRVGRQLGDRELLAWSLWHLFYETGELLVGEECTALFREGGNRAGLVYALYLLGNRALHGGDDAAARSHYEESLAIARQMGVKADLARPIAGLAVLAWRQGDYAAARSLYEETVALRREAGDLWLARYVNALGSVICEQGDYERATALFEESLALSEENGHKRAIAGSLAGMGTVAWRQGDYEAARSLCEQALELFTEVGDRWGLAQTLTTLGAVALAQGDATRARSCLQQSLTLASELETAWGSAASLGPWSKLGSSGHVAECLEGLAGVAGAQAKPESAARLFGAAAAWRDAARAPVIPADRAEHERQVTSVRAALGEKRFSDAWAEGQSMSLKQAMAFALDPSHASPTEAE